MPKVLISDKLSPAAIEVFEKAGVEVDNKPGLSPEELMKIIGEYDGLAIRSATKVTAEVLDAAKKLKVVGRAGIGVDNVDVSAATERGVIVMNTPFGNSVTTAEHSVAMMMSLARSIPQASASTHAGKWEKNKFMGVELCGKTLGLIGCGNIGSIVADRAIGLKMKVVVYDPFLSVEKAASLHVEKVELDDLLARADFISLHTPLTDGTRGILGEENLKKCKKGVRIVNCARGGLIDESALKAAIESGHVAGAALDVFEVEPAKENPLFGVEQVVCTPHLGASTAEAQENVAVQVAEQMAAYLKHGSISNALNVSSLTAEEAKVLKPYLQLAEQLGSFAGQITRSGLKAVRIEYEGDVAELATKPLVSAALLGLLRPLMEDVNMVNAPSIAKARGIEVSETKSTRRKNYQTLIRLTIVTDNRERDVSGTLFGDQPRIVEMEGRKLEAGLNGVMLYVHNEDKPGLIGGLGQILGDAGINIANFHLGRGGKEGDALALIELDQAPDKDVMKQVEALPSVRQAQLLRF